MERNLTDRDKRRLKKKRERERIVRKQRAIVAGVLVVIVLGIIVAVGSCGHDDETDSERTPSQEAAQSEANLSETGPITDSGLQPGAETQPETEAEAQPTLSPQEEAIAAYQQLGIADVMAYLNIRQSMDTESTIVGRLPSGGACEILGEEGDWTHITSGGIEGYVQSRYLFKGDEAKSQAMNYIQQVEGEGGTQYVLPVAEAAQ